VFVFASIIGLFLPSGLVRVRASKYLACHGQDFGRHFVEVEALVKSSFRRWLVLVVGAKIFKEALHLIYGRAAGLIDSRLRDVQRLEALR